NMHSNCSTDIIVSYSPRVPFYLHSFPTLRSSDLVTHTDGFPVQPQETESIYISIGERVDVEVTLGDGVFPLTALAAGKDDSAFRSEEHTSELRHDSISYSLFCLK